MCGIAGWFGPRGQWDADVLRDGLARRGPDGSGVWQSDKATLVHTRLAVIGLGEQGAQPMVRGDAAKSDAVLVFNGEIYNYRELGSADAESDTAVLLELLEREARVHQRGLVALPHSGTVRPATRQSVAQHIRVPLTARTKPAGYSAHMIIFVVG